MKSTVFALLAACAVSLPAQALPTHDVRTVVLSDVIDGSCDPALKGVQMTVSYDFNFETNVGQAYLKQVGDATTNVDLYPIGVSSKYSFISDSYPFKLTVNGKQQTVYRTLFTLEKNGEVGGFMMFGEDGECTLASPEA